MLLVKNDPSNVIGEFTKSCMFLFGEVIGDMILFSGIKIFYKSLLVKKTIPRMLLVKKRFLGFFLLVRLLEK
jgi:Ca2+/Na+ antiporter